jgi:hypothetical protein
MKDELAEQRLLLETWLQSDEALRVAQRLVHSRRLRRSPEELVSEAWLKLDRHLNGRATAFPDLRDEISAGRYLYRVLDNLSRDMLRADNRRNDLELVDQALVSAHSEGVETRMMLEQLVWSVGRLAATQPPCDGCSSVVVASAALSVLHLLLADSDGAINGRTALDRLLYEALQHASHRPLSDEALRQRKARCGKCITELLTDGLREIGMVAA